MALTKHQVRVLGAAVGTFTANGATAVPVTPTVPLTATSIIRYTLKTVGGTPAGHPFESAITTGPVGTATFSVKAVAGDTSIYNYSIEG